MVAFNSVKSLFESHGSFIGLQTAASKPKIKSAVL